MNIYTEDCGELKARSNSLVVQDHRLHQVSADWLVEDLVWERSQPIVIMQLVQILVGCNISSEKMRNQ